MKVTDVNEFAPEFLPSQPPAYPPSVAGAVTLLNESFSTAGPVSGPSADAGAGVGTGAVVVATYVVRVRENWLEPSTEVLRLRARDRDDSPGDSASTSSSSPSGASSWAATATRASQQRAGPAVRYSFADTEFHVSAFAHDTGAVLSDRFRIDEQTGTPPLRPLHFSASYREHTE